MISDKVPMFRKLELARKAVAPFLSPKTTKLAVVFGSVPSTDWLDAVISALVVAKYRLPKYTSKKKDEPPTLDVEIGVGSTELSPFKAKAEMAEALAQGTNLVRRLAVMAGNDLTTESYVKEAMALGKASGLTSEFLSYDKLKAMGAGAFCAVAQASTGTPGILKLHYRPKAPRAAIALVGKGITYDTGGAQLKSGEHMFGMNGDMGGSAVALALAIYFAKVKSPFSVTAYLAIADNQLSPHSYRPNDVVTSLIGKTIEVIDTDAEGRMVLADALTLASRGEKNVVPQLVIDFATLTGSCVRAIGTRLSGGYSNHKPLLTQIRKAGEWSGERVWPFPNHADYGRCLKSSVADLKQCREKGGVDHIEASFFLRQFIENKVPYVHVDLSACENDGGLGHVPTKVTGFGVRFGAELVRRQLG